MGKEKDANQQPNVKILNNFHLHNCFVQIITIPSRYSYACQPKPFSNLIFKLKSDQTVTHTHSVLCEWKGDNIITTYWQCSEWGNKYIRQAQGFNWHRFPFTATSNHMDLSGLACTGRVLRKRRNQLCLKDEVWTMALQYWSFPGVNIRQPVRWIFNTVALPMSRQK